VREFRARYDEFLESGVSLACVSRQSVQSNRDWAERLSLPYPLLSDPDGSGGRALGAVRRVALGPWTMELVRRATMLIDVQGTIAAAWSSIKVRGHALEVLEYARASRLVTPS